MSSLTGPAHLDDWTLLRHTVADLDRTERETVDRHLEDCPACEEHRREIAELHLQLRDLVGDGEWTELEEGDPFARRPRKWEPGARLPLSQAETRAAQALAASERGTVEAQAILAAGRSREALRSHLSGLSLSDPACRFALLYALQTAEQLIAEDPTDSAALAEEILLRLQPEVSRLSESDRLVPLPLLTGHAHLLAGQSGNWTGDYERAGRHFAEAYRLFGEGTGDPFNLAQVEYQESQRRSFSGRAREGLILARRGLRAFEALDLEDYVARAKAAEGNALYFLGEPRQALESYRAALAVFERLEMWSNYVGVINSVGECLLKLGEPEESRRQYARALRRVSREKQPAWIAFIRHGLANAMFSAGRYREAAAAFGRAARLNRELGLLAIALTAALYEIESWARSGDPGRAAHRFEIWMEEITRRRALDESLARSIERALAGEDLATVALLRQEAEGMLRERLKEKKIS
jgi:tetratricopeptide (TPR) repeat protein